MKKKITLLLVAAIAAVSVVGSVSAQQGLGRFGEGQRIVPELLQIVADQLGIEPSEVLGQLRGQSLEDVITTNGGNVEAIRAEVIAAITERVNAAVADETITQARADLMLENLAGMVERALNGEFGGFGLRDGLREGLPDIRREFRQGQGRGEGMGSGRLGQMFQDRSPLLNAAADATGLTTREIAQELRSGSTLSEVVTANGGSPEAVIQAAVATVQARHDQAVENGRITQAQADAMLGGVQAYFEAAMNGAFQPQGIDEAV